ncbi:MAG: sulfotransferase [Pseudomonadota bacterium]|nr:sulfotransferase [Pseudomonadota bacterium]
MTDVDETAIAEAKDAETIVDLAAEDGKLAVKVNDQLRKAQEHMAKGEVPQAFSACRLVVHAERHNDAANYNMAAILLQRQNAYAAFGYAMTAVEAKPDSPLYQVTLASALLGLNCLDAATKALDSIHPHQRIVAPQMIQALRNSIEAKRRSVRRPLLPVRATQADIVKKVGQNNIASEQARDEIIRAILGNPKDDELWHLLFGHFFLINQHVQAEGCIRRALALKPDVARYYTSLAQIHDAMGEQRFAELIFRQGLTNTEPDSGLVHQYGGLLVRMGKGRWPDAEKLLEKYHELGKNNPGYLSLYAQVKDFMSKFDEASALMDRVVALAESDPGLYNNAFNFFLQNDAVDKAREVADAANSRLGATVMVRSLYGLLAAAEDNHAETLRYLSDIKPEQVRGEVQPRLQFALARAYASEKRFKDAYDAYQKGNDARAKLMNAKYRYNSEEYIQQCEKTARDFTPENVATWTRPELKAEDRRPHGFIFGLPRSGTTLLDTFLRAHSETELLEEEPYAGLSIAKYLGKAGDDGLSGLEYDDMIGVRQAYWDKLAQVLGEDAMSKYIIDRHPLHTASPGQFHRFFPDSKKVFIARHPLDVILSGFMQDFQLSGPMANYLDLERATKFYDRTMKAFFAGVESMDIDMHFLRYEDLVANPEKELRALIDHLGLDWQPDVLEHQRSAESRDRIRTASHSQVRKPIYKTARYRWRDYTFALEPFIPMVEEWIERFDYEL